MVLRQPSIVLPLLIFIFAFTELAMVTFLQKSAGPYVSPFILLVAGLLTGWLFIKYCEGKKLNLNKKANKHFLKFPLSIVAIVIMAIGFAYTITPQLNKFPFSSPQSATGSDVIPQIQMLVQRCLSGEFPYKLIHHTEWAFNHNLFPTYLPLTWMPYIVPEQIGMDYRWFALLCLLGAFTYFLYFFSRIKFSNLIFLALAPVGILFLFFYAKFDIFSLSVETLITAFYLCLALTLLTNSTISKAIFILVCLLSRYSIILWVPLFFVVIWLKEKKSTSYSILSILFAGFVLIYFIPFLSQDITIYKQGYDYHTKAAIGLWSVRSFQNSGDTPMNLLQGFGFGCYFYEWLDMELSEKVRMYRLTHLGLSLLSVALLGIYFFKKKRLIDHRLFLLGSLKIYLVVFYNFIQIPFHYLFLVPIFISLPIIGTLLSGCIKPSPA